MKRMLIAALTACLSLSAHAQQAGDNVAVLGWFHVAPKDSSSALTTNVAPVPINTPLRLPNSFTSAGTGAETTCEPGGRWIVQSPMVVVLAWSRTSSFLSDSGA